MGEATWFLKPGFRVRTADRDASVHKQGGPNVHKGAVCGGCQRPLLLLWSIDCRDERFAEVDPTRSTNSRASLRSFRKLKLLPLYYCWRCVTDLSYRLLTPRRIEVLHEQTDFQGEDWPYENYPEAFPESELELEVIPNDVEALIHMVENESRWIDSDETRRLNEWFDSEGDFDFGTPWLRRFGGPAASAHGREFLACKNKDCDNYQAADEWWTGGEPMRVLAVMHESPELPMLSPEGDQDEAQVFVRICRACHTIRVVNRCD